MIFLLITAGALLALVLLVIVLLPVVIDEQAIVEIAQEQVRTKTNGELRVNGEPELSIFPDLVLVLSDTTFDLPLEETEGQRLVADIGHVDINLSLLGLLQGDNSIGTIRLSAIKARVLDASDVVQTSVNVKELRAEGLNVADQPIRLYTIIRVPSSSDPSDETVDAHAVELTLDGQVRTPSDLSRVDIDSLSVTVTGVLTEPVNAQLQGRYLMTPPAFDGALRLITPGGEVQGNVAYISNDSPKMDIRLKSQRLDLDQLTVITNEGQSAQDEPPNAPPVPLPVGPLKTLDLRLVAQVTELVTAGQRIEDADLELRVVDGIAKLQPLTGTLHGGQLDTQITVNAQKPVVSIEVTGSLAGVELDSLLSSFEQPNTAKGNVNIGWDIETQGTLVVDLSNGLDGDIQLKGEGVEITAVSLQAMVCEAVAIVNQDTLRNTMPATTEVSALAMTIEFEAGEAVLKDTTIATDGVSLTGNGRANLSNNNFRARFDAKLDNRLQALDNACRVNDRYTALDWPILCEGNLTEDPAKSCAIDSKAIAQQLLKNEAESTLKKEAGKLLNKLFGN